ncbi:unnamed protein product [Allacma fusca]|uniref:Heparan-alpha-glucosaminide N-acetyltransferase catalytic domain-containing protein n=1 Tax=Allacma fusca TaxID=39272 RepID=A0A8J2NNN5_9HEXA|nr:unnamed protein product [Allacma fusca]
MSWIESRPDRFGNYDINSLRVDQAFINFTSDLASDVWLYELSADCLQCPYRLLQHVGKSAGDSVVKISTAFPHKFRFRSSDKELVVPEFNDSYQICDINHDFGEFGVYEVRATDSPDKICQMEVLLEPVNIYLPLVIVLLFVILVDILVWLSRNYHTVLPKLFCNKMFTNLKAPGVVERPKSSRLISLDAFRGLCILLMIFVHDGGASYRFMQHATWDGLQVADIIFPWFLWIMGVCIPISLKGQYKKQIPTKTIIKKAGIRGLKLLCLGLMLGTIGGSPQDLKFYRIFGVLQRFGITYFLCTLLAVWSLKERFQVNEEVFYHRNSFVKFKHLHKFQTVLQATLGLVVSITTPPSLDTVSEEWQDTLTEKFGAKIICSFGQVWVGVQTGFTFLTYPDEPVNILSRLGFRAVLQGLIGGLLCNWQQAGGWIPVNKNLWSLSYVLVTNAMAIILLGVMYVVIDLYKIWTGSPIMEAGMNSIFLYVVHLTVQKMSPWHWTYGSMDTHFLKLIESTWGISLWVLMAVWMHRKKIYYKTSQVDF